MTVQQMHKIAQLIVDTAYDLSDTEGVTCESIEVGTKTLSKKEVSEGSVDLTITNTGCINMWAIDVNGVVTDFEQA